MNKGLRLILMVVAGSCLSSTAWALADTSSVSLDGPVPVDQDVHLSAGYSTSETISSRRDILVWQMRLNSTQCTSASATPCFNIYVINSTTGELLWFAYSTDITAIKRVFVGRRTLYFTTWAGPGLYSVSLASGRIRWQFPLNNWFAYWRKQIDLPPWASFSEASEAGAGAMFVASAGPPARVYGLRAKHGGDQQWEWKADRARAALVGTAGPDVPDPSRGASARRGGGERPAAGAVARAAASAASHELLAWLGRRLPGAQGGGGGASPAAAGAAPRAARALLGASGGPGAAAATAAPPPAGVLYLALSESNGSASSWLAAVSLADGSQLWAGQEMPGAVFGAVQLDGPRLLVADSESEQLYAFDKVDGRLLWRRGGAYCPSPSPISRTFYPVAAPLGAAGGSGNGLKLLLLSGSCGSLAGLTAIDASSGLEAWSGLDLPRPAGDSAQITEGCSWVAVDAGTIYLGCNCRQPEQRGSAREQGRRKGRGRGGRRRRRHRGGGDSGGGGGGADDEGDDEDEDDVMVCLYAADLATGRRIWWRQVEDLGGAAFDPDAQVWGQAPVVLRGAVVFFTNTTVVAVSAASGKELWRAPVDDGERVAPWQLAAQVWMDGRGGGGGFGAGVEDGAAGGGGGDGDGVDGASSNSHGSLLLVQSLRGAGNKTSLYALDTLTGKEVWGRDFNGSAQQPLSPASGGAAPLVLGPRVFLDSCRRGRCCLRGLNTTSGKSSWAMCLDAARGTDPTNPKAQFAIWIVTLVAIASIAALILGAALLYLQRWADERSLVGGSPHNGGGDGYAPLAAGAASGSAGGPRRTSLFARAGGAAGTVFGGPPSPGSLAAEAMALDGEMAAGPIGDPALGPGGPHGGGAHIGPGGTLLMAPMLFGGRERVRVGARAGRPGGEEVRVSWQHPQA